MWQLRRRLGHLLAFDPRKSEVANEHVRCELRERHQGRGAVLEGPHLVSVSHEHDVDESHQQALVLDQKNPHPLPLDGLLAPATSVP